MHQRVGHKMASETLNQEMASETLNQEIAETSQKGFVGFVKLSVASCVAIAITLLLMLAFLV